MAAEVGYYSLILALVLAVYQSIFPFVGAHRNDERLMATAVPVAQAQFGFLIIAFSTLMYAYIVSDFSVENVFKNSHTDKPMIYKITGVWANHEGSMILWMLILTLFSAAVATFGQNLPAKLKARVLGVQGSITAAFLIFVILTSNPFIRVSPTPLNGEGMNPLLQDPGIAIHPPLLYLGYVGFSLVFSFAIAALIEGRVDAAWARWVRPWTLVAWMFLTVGISMGSWWAYYELGWGGWWFWDPVENASFMPWLAGTALLHSAIVVEKRDTMKVWTILLAIIAFSLSLLGTFLVRSGVLTSVHAFANDPDRGLFMLAILAFFIGGAFALFAWRAPAFKSGGMFAPISREGALMFNNLILTTGCATVFIGTLYPLVLETITGTKISVGPQFFNSTFTPLMVPLLLLVPLGPFLAWKRGDLAAVAQRLSFAAIFAAIVLVFVFGWVERGPIMAPFGVALAAWLVAGSISEFAYRIGLFRVALMDSLNRAIKLPRSVWGTAFAHGGLGVVVLGITAISAWQIERVEVVDVGATIQVAGIDVEFVSLEPRTGPNYKDDVGLFRISVDGKLITEIESAKRLYQVPVMATTEAGIYSFWSGDIYVTLGDKSTTGNAWVLRVYFNPLAQLIWFGSGIMFFGGMVSLTDRRYRVGAPRKKRSKKRAKAAAKEVPA